MNEYSNVFLTAEDLLDLEKEISKRYEVKMVTLMFENQCLRDQYYDLETRFLKLVDQAVPDVNDCVKEKECYCEKCIILP